MLEQGKVRVQVMELVLAPVLALVRVMVPVLALVRVQELVPRSRQVRRRSAPMPLGLTIISFSLICFPPICL